MTTDDEIIAEKQRNTILKEKQQKISASLLG